jgi:hypothetical protein
MRIEVAACGLRADCGALSAPWYNPGYAPEIELALCGLRQPGADHARITARFPHPDIILDMRRKLASFVRIAASECGSRADCGALSAPWYL